jgi:phenylacetate-CoA ligase
LWLATQGDILKDLHHLEQWQWLDQEQTQALQGARLKQLLIHAYHHVPYYRDVLRRTRVVDGRGSVNLDRFVEIPLLDKATIRSRFEELMPDGLEKGNCHEKTSGGSTGEPVRLIQDECHADWGQALKWLYSSWSGYHFGDGQILLWGSERDLLVGQETLKTRVGRWLRNEIWLNAFRMTVAQMRKYVEQINALKPVQILAYAQSFYELTSLVEREGLRVHSPRSIMTSADTLYPHMRNTIERVFRAPVFNRYGSREVGDVACECDHHKGLHVSSPTHYVEILDQSGRPANPGEVGELVITLLTNYAMPLIRYRIGDMGAWASDPCTCGRGWPLLKEVTGRMTDIFVKQDGTIVPPEYLTRLIHFSNTDWVEKFQFIQENYNHLSVVIVPREQVGDPKKSHQKEINAITEKIRLVMGKDCRIGYQFVSDIAPTPSGKYRCTISKVRDERAETKA